MKEVGHFGSRRWFVIVNNCNFSGITDWARDFKLDVFNENYPEIAASFIVDCATINLQSGPGIHKLGIWLSCGVWFPTFPLLRGRASSLVVRDACISSDSIFFFLLIIFKFPEGRGEGFDWKTFDSLVISSKSSPNFHNDTN